MSEPDPTDSLSEAALLAEPLRRRLYRYVASSSGDVSRDQAAAALRVDRGLAAFHLDRLVEAGFLETSFRRLSERSGPGAGRPSKLYRRSGKRLELSVPPTRYETLAQLLAQTVSTLGPPAVRELTHAARKLGRALGSAARRRGDRRAGESALMRAAERELRDRGFEPRREPGGVLRLTNCPFDALAVAHRELVCGMNYELMDSFVDALGAREICAVKDPRPGMCCVALRAKAKAVGG